MKVAQELKDYITHMETLAKALPQEKQDELAQIFSVVLTLLVSLKRDSKMGRFTSTHFDD